MISKDSAIIPIANLQNNPSQTAQRTSQGNIYSSGIGKLVNNSPNLKNNLKSEYTIEFRYISNDGSNSRISELNQLYQYHNGKLNGKFELLIDNVVRSEWTIINGNTTLTKSVNSSGESYPCNFDGLSECTQDRIDNMNLFEKTLCIIAGFECVATQFASCAWDNCGGAEMEEYVLTQESF